MVTCQGIRSHWVQLLPTSALQTPEICSRNSVAWIPTIINVSRGIQTSLLIAPERAFSESGGCCWLSSHENAFGNVLVGLDEISGNHQGGMSSLPCQCRFRFGHFGWELNIGNMVPTCRHKRKTSHSDNVYCPIRPCPKATQTQFFSVCFWRLVSCCSSARTQGESCELVNQCTDILTGLLGSLHPSVLPRQLEILAIVMARFYGDFSFQDPTLGWGVLVWCWCPSFLSGDLQS